MISVITPCKNVIRQGRQAFFRKMMQTLRTQSYQNFEHILVDGGSQDGTAELLGAYVASKHIDTLIVQQDTNLHEALNRGLAWARGEFIYIMNTDNYFATDQFFERSLAAIKKHNVDYTHGDRIIVARNGSAPTVKRGDLRVAFFRMPFRWQTMLIKKSIYDQFGPLDERFKIAADYQFMLKMILAGTKGYYFPENLIYSLDGGITMDRQTCIAEVTTVLYECYGQKYGLDLDECRQIYLRRISPKLFVKICTNVGDQRIRDSLIYGYQQQQGAYA